jgi:hypothetical protein
MDIFKEIINKIGTPYPFISTIVVMLLAGAFWALALKTLGNSPTESSGHPDSINTPSVTNTTTGAGSPIITDNHGHIDIKAQQSESGKQNTEQPK